MSVRWVGVILAGLASVSFAQNDPTAVTDTATIVVDSVSQAVMQDTSGQDTVASSRVSEMPPAAKIGFTPERNFDLSVLPVLPGKREDPRAEVGKFTKLHGEFVEQQRPRYGSVKGGYGIYQTIMAECWFAANSPNSDVLIRGGYRASDGKEAFTDFSKGSAELTARTLLSHSPSAGSMTGTLGFATDEYRLYGSASPSNRRTAVRFHGDAKLRSAIGERGEFAGNVGFESVRFTDVLQVRSSTISGSLGFIIPLGELHGFIEAGAKKSLVSGSGGDDPQMLLGRLGLRKAFGEEVLVEAGAGVYNASGSNGQSMTRFVPEASITWYAGSGTTVAAVYRPGVEFVSFERLLEENPYLSHGTAIMHTDVRSNMRLSLEREFSDRASGKVSIGYKSVDALPLYVDPLLTGEWSLAYPGRSEFYDVTVEYQTNPSERHVLGVTGVWRDSKNSAAGITPPYIPDWEAGLSYGHGFTEKVRLLNRISYRGKQSPDLQGKRSLAGNLRWDAELQIYISKVVALSAVAENLLDQRQERWEGYRGEPRRVAAAISVSW